MSTHPNLAWQWPSRVLSIFPDRCDDYACLFDADRRHQFERGDGSRCGWHGRLRVVIRTRYSGDSNGGTTLTYFRRLRPWRLGYWRARRMLAAPPP